MCKAIVNVVSVLPRLSVSSSELGTLGSRSRNSLAVLTKTVPEFMLYKPCGRGGVARRLGAPRVEKGT